MNKDSESLAAGILAIFVLLMFLLLVPIFATIIGMFTGWVVGLFFTGILTEVMVAFGIQPVAIWKLGGFLGFVSGFFRTYKNSSK